MHRNTFRMVKIINFHILSLIHFLGNAVAFIQFEDNKAYEFHFKSKFVLDPQSLGGQNVSATVLVKKFGRNDLIIRIKDSTFTGNNVHSESQSDIEGVFGITRDPSDGEITNIISAPSSRGMAILCKKMLVDMLSDNLSYFQYYAKNHDTLKDVERHKIKFAVGNCEAEMKGVVDTAQNLTQILAQAEKSYCNVDPIIIQAGQLLLHGTTSKIGEILDNSNFGVSVFFDSTTQKVVKVAKFTFLNLLVGLATIQARHNQVLHYVGEHEVNNELDFNGPHVSDK